MDINQQLRAHLGLNIKPFEQGLDKANRAAERAGRRQRRSFMATARGAAMVTAAVVAAAAALGTYAERGAKVTAVSQGFTRQVGHQDVALSKLRTATNGLVADYDLMVQANMALTLGSARTVDEFARLAEVAQKLGRTLGLETAFALNSLNVGIARQSRLVLDNLGIIVDVDAANRAYATSLGKTVKELTEYERKQAFANEAMRQAEEAADRMGEVVLGAGGAFGVLKTNVSNFFDDVAARVNEMGSVERFFLGLSEAVKALGGNASAARNAVRLLFTGLDPLAAGGQAPGPVRLSDGVTYTHDGFDEMRRRRQLEGRVYGMGSLDPTRRFDPLTGRPIGTQDPFLPNGGVSVPRIGGAVGSTAGIGARIDHLRLQEETKQAREEQEKLAETIKRVSRTIEGALVRSLTRAIMKFESISELIKDIGKSLLSGFVSGLVSFGVGALTNAALGAFGVGPAQKIVAAGAPKNAVSSVRAGGPTNFQFSVSSDHVPEPADYGILASKAQIQKLLADTLDATLRNGYQPVGA